MRGLHMWFPVLFSTCASNAIAASSRTVAVDVELKAPDARAVLVFAHGDGFQLIGKPLAAGPRVTTKVRVASNVDRIVLMPVPAGFKLERMPGCTKHHCVGQIDVVDQRIVPFVPVWRGSQVAVATAPTNLKDKEHKMLQARLSLMAVPGAFKPAALVRHDLEREVTYTSDQAQYVLTMLRHKHVAAAMPVLNALANLQRGDGSYAPAYTQSGVVVAESQERIESVVAWVNLAFSTYAETTGDDRFGVLLSRGRHFLAAHDLQMQAAFYNPSGAH